MSDACDVIVMGATANAWVKTDALSSQRVHARRSRGGVAVRADAVRAQRVDREDDEISRGGLRRGRRRRAPAGSGECRPEQHESDRAGHQERMKEEEGRMKKKRWHASCDSTAAHTEDTA